MQGFWVRSTLVVGSILAMSLVSTVSFAAKPSQETLEFCGGTSSMAKSVMTSRQSGVAMSKLMEATSSDEAVNDLGALMIEQAYDSPAYGSPEYKNKAATDFENRWFSNCLKARAAAKN